MLQKGEINRTDPIPGIDVTTTDAECYYWHVPGCFSNNFPEVQVEQCRNVEQVTEALEEELAQ